MCRPPEYGSPAWHALAADDPARHEALVRAAESWRLLRLSPHVAGLLGEWVEWDRRRTLAETSHAISASADWRAIANTPTYAELQRRRNHYDHEPLTPEQIRERARASWAAYEGRQAA